MRLIKTSAGRKKSKRPNDTNDCAVRALSIAFEIAYDDAYILCKVIGKRRYADGMYTKNIIATAELIARIQNKRIVFIGSKIPQRGCCLVEYSDHINTAVHGVIYDEYKSDYRNKQVVSVWKIV